MLTVRNRRVLLTSPKWSHAVRESGELTELGGFKLELTELAAQGLLRVKAASVVRWVPGFMVLRELGGVDLRMRELVGSTLEWSELVGSRIGWEGLGCSAVSEEAWRFPAETEEDWLREGGRRLQVLMYGARRLVVAEHNAELQGIGIRRIKGVRRLQTKSG